MAATGEQVAEETRVVLIEDLREMREGLRFLIDNTAGYKCVGAYSSVEGALSGVSQRPHVVLTDIGLPGLSGIDGIKRLRMRFPDLPVIALTVYDDGDHVFDALCAGAAGYLLKTTPPSRLIEALRDVVAGGATISPEIARKLVTVFTQVRPPETSDYKLTPHEVRLLKLLMDGHSYKTAAAELNSSINTVAFHVRNIYRKLQVHSKSEAVVKAMRAGLI